MVENKDSKIIEDFEIQISQFPQSWLLWFKQNLQIINHRLKKIQSNRLNRKIAANWGQQIEASKYQIVRTEFYANKESVFKEKFICSGLACLSW